MCRALTPARFFKFAPVIIIMTPVFNERIFYIISILSYVNGRKNVKQSKKSFFKLFKSTIKFYFY